MIEYKFDTQLLIEGTGLDEDAIYDYFDLLKSGKIRNSEGAYDVMVSNKGYKKPAQTLQDIGFSSDPNYASKLIAIIEENDLTTYDK